MVVENQNYVLVDLDELVVFSSPKLLVSPALQRPKLREHWQNVSLQKLGQSVGELCFTPEIDVLSFCDSKQNLKEFKAVQLIVVVVVLLGYFIIGRLPIAIKYALMHFSVNDTCIFAKLEEFSFAEVRWCVIHDGRRYENLFQGNVACFKDFQNGFCLALASTNLQDLPVLLVVTEAFRDCVCCVFVPVLEY